jgi:hypothetical protein
MRLKSGVRTFASSWRRPSPVEGVAEAKRREGFDEGARCHVGRSSTSIFRPTRYSCAATRSRPARFGSGKKPSSPVTKPFVSCGRSAAELLRLTEDEGRHALLDQDRARSILPLVDAGLALPLCLRRRPRLVARDARAVPPEEEERGPRRRGASSGFMMLSVRRSPMKMPLHRCTTYRLSLPPVRSNLRAHRRQRQAVRRAAMQRHLHR